MNKKFYNWYFHGYDRLPRKMKKQVLGKKIANSRLKSMLAETVVGDPIKTMFEIVEFTPHGAFCPRCGCKSYKGSGNLTEYPEHWEKFYCLRCKNVVGYIDNSPFIHALECKENNYNPVF